MWYISWDESFPTSSCATVDNYGGVPMLTWEPWLATANTLEAISGGAYDAYISAFAQDAKAWGKLVYLRFGHEMNGNWYPWDGSHNGGAAGPAKYIAAWCHIHDLFAAAGATNVKFVWSVNSSDSPAEDWNKAAAYYPGDAYVDWIGFDGYNWGAGNWQTFDQIFSAAYGTFETYGKPLMISEFACAEEGGDKAAWITAAFTGLKTNYPSIEACVWFNINKAGERDWRVDSSTAALNAYKNAVTDPYFLETKPAR